MGKVSASATRRDGPDARAGRGLRFPSALAVAAGGGLVLGGLTQVGQSSLPSWLSSLANSGAPWVPVAFGLALSAGPLGRPPLPGRWHWPGLEIGYVIVAALRNFPSASTAVIFWLVAAVAFGPPAGLGAYFLRVRKAPWDALGGGLLAGIVAGEGLVAFLKVRDTTSPGYWIAQLVVGAVLAVLVGRWTGSAWVLGAFLVGVAALGATRFVPGLGT